MVLIELVASVGVMLGGFPSFALCAFVTQALAGLHGAGNAAHTAEIQAGSLGRPEGMALFSRNVKHPTFALCANAASKTSEVDADVLTKSSLSRLLYRGSSCRLLSQRSPIRSRCLTSLFKLKTQLPAIPKRFLKSRAELLNGQHVAVTSCTSLLRALQPDLLKPWAATPPLCASSRSTDFQISISLHHLHLSICLCFQHQLKFPLYGSSSCD
ncbi:uncharacterized protein LOC125693053 [Lagopus muta]|uniref:uncharacterized protein LOC125693053 n=1 Tax=Lagopus muta TaxID=64668 RepID=UPI0020A0D7DF|nr:uncharacterized protein LOC125693053 [Lagopus muta]